MGKPAPRYYSLEACRGVAALVVVFRHMCVHAFEGPHYMFLLPSPSALAVIYFFVLSGAVMGLAHPPGQASLGQGGNFLLRRALRIYPLYWLVLAAFLLRWPMVFRPDQFLGWLFLIPDTAPDGTPIIRDALPPPWTLHWEVLFYLIFAVSLITPWRRTILAVWLAAILLWKPLFGLPAFTGWVQQTVLLIISPMGLFFLAGLAVAWAVRRYSFSARVGWALLGVAACAVAYDFWRLMFGLILPYNLHDFCIIAVGMGALTAALIILESNHRLPVGGWCLTLGKISYPTYISHWLFMELVYREFWLHHYDVIGHAFIYAAAIFAASLLGGVAVTYLIDLPMQRGFRRVLSAWGTPGAGRRFLRFLGRLTGRFGFLRGYCGKSAMVAVFLVCAVPVTLMSALLTPLGQVPDEPAHVARAAGLTHGAIMGVRKQTLDWATGKPEISSGVKVDAGLVEASFGKVTPVDGRNVLTQADADSLWDVRWAHQAQFLHIPNTVAYFPLAYVPAAVGIELGKLCGARPAFTVTMARIGMALAFFALGAAALRIAAYGEAFLLCVLLLPMTLFLAGTVNQDGVLVAMTCLACAAVTRGTNGWRMLGLGLFAAVLGSKPPYLPMLGVFLLPLFRPGFTRRIGEVAAACVPVLAWVALILVFVIVPFGKGLYHPGPLYPGGQNVWMDHTNAAMNLHILLAQPARFITLPWHTMSMYGQDNFQEMIGALGLLQVIMPGSYYSAWEICGALALLGLLLTHRPVQETRGVKLASFLWVLFLVLFTTWLVMIQFYLDWSNVGIDFVDGVQGRYGLVLLPFLIFAMPGLRGRFMLPPLAPALPVVAMGLYDIVYIPVKLATFYYLH